MTHKAWHSSLYLLWLAWPCQFLADLASAKLDCFTIKGNQRQTTKSEASFCHKLQLVVAGCKLRPSCASFTALSRLWHRGFQIGDRFMAIIVVLLLREATERAPVWTVSSKKKEAAPSQINHGTGEKGCIWTLRVLRGVARVDVLPNYWYLAQVSPTLTGQMSTLIQRSASCGYEAQQGTTSKVVGSLAFHTLPSANLPSWLGRLLPFPFKRGVHWPWVKSQIVPPVNIRFNPTTIGSEMGGEFTYQPKWDPKTVLTTAISPMGGNVARDRPLRCFPRCPSPPRLLRRCGSILRVTWIHKSLERGASKKFGKLQQKDGKKFPANFSKQFGKKCQITLPSKESLRASWSLSFQT